jgi:tetratricopeptide (TPR) repeat protein
MVSPTGPSPDRTSALRRRGTIGCLAAVALAGLVYVNALDNPFIYDDYRLVVENRAIADIREVRAIVAHDATRPLVALSYALDRKIWGPGPFGFHLTNVVLHMANVGLFAWFVWSACEDRRRRPGSSGMLHATRAAPIAALLFAIHPLMTEAVGYVSGRSELLCGAFFLLALHAGRAALLSRRTSWLFVTLGCWVLALASKETALLFPVVLFLYDRWVLPTIAVGGLRRALYLTLGSVAVILACARLAVFLWIEHSKVSIQWSLIWVELDAVRQYVAMLILPYGQSIFHEVSVVGPTSPGVLVALVGIIVCVGAAWRWRRGHGLASLGAFWFLLLLVPSSLLVLFDRGEPMAEHRVYIASMGAFLIAGLAVDRLVGWLALRRATATLVLASLTVAIVVAFGGRTYLRNEIWSDPVMVWLEAAERAPNSWFPALLLGEELHRAGQHDQAIGAYRRAIQARPGEPGPHGKLALCLAELGDLAGAEAEFARQRELDPAATDATNGLATMALLRGDLKTARLRYLDTLAIDQINIAARRGLAAIEEAPGGNPAEALRWCEDIKRLAPETPGNDDCIRRNQDRIAGRTSGS